MLLPPYTHTHEVCEEYYPRPFCEDCGRRECYCRAMEEVEAMTGVDPWERDDTDIDLDCDADNCACHERK